MREMKDSGVEWIGKIPKEWKTIKFNNATLRLGTGLNPRDNFELTKDDEFYYVTIRNFKDGKLFLDENCDKISKNAWGKIQERSQLAQNDILFASISKDAQAYLLNDNPENWNINESVFCIKINQKYFFPRYFYYQITNAALYDDLRLDATGTTFQSIKQKKLNKSILVCPSLQIQNRIATYLDSKCSKIDAIIEHEQALIEKLKEYKLSVITEAVTKGLNPDVEMKDSGLKWVDMIPDNWENRKLISVLSMRVVDGPHESPELFDEGIPYISATSINKGKIDFSKKRGFISKTYCDLCDIRYKPQLHDILVIKLGASTGQVGIVETEERFNIWVPLAAVRVDKNTNPYFIYYAFQSNYFWRQMELLWTFGTQQTLGVKTIERLRVLLPSIEEQNEIVDYLKEKCGMIDGYIDKRQGIVEKLTEYKKSLIYEVVTGKKEV